MQRMEMTELSSSSGAANPSTVMDVARTRRRVSIAYISHSREHEYEMQWWM